MINVCEDLKNYKEIQEILDYLKEDDKENLYISFIGNLLSTRTYNFKTQFMYEMSNETIARLLWGIIITADNDYKDVVYEKFTRQNYSNGLHYSVWDTVFHKALKTDWRKLERDRKRKEKKRKRYQNKRICYSNGNIYKWRI